MVVHIKMESTGCRRIAHPLLIWHPEVLVEELVDRLDRGVEEYRLHKVLEVRRLDRLAMEHMLGREHRVVLEYMVVLVDPVLDPSLDRKGTGMGMEMEKDNTRQSHQEEEDQSTMAVAKLM